MLGVRSRASTAGMDDAVTSGGTWLKSGTEGILFRMNHSELGDPLHDHEHIKCTIIYKRNFKSLLEWTPK
jgi:hypothetical protein